MLRSMKDLEHYALAATDGHIGHVKDVYFDDDAWVIRWLVVDTGSWLSSREVLISPISIHRPDWAERVLPVSLSKDQVKHSPSVDTHKPVSRQHELQYLGYYGYPSYWGDGGMWGAGMYPYALVSDYAPNAETKAERDREVAVYARIERARHRHDDPHLRSGKAVVGYHLHATDGEVGHVDGLLVDEDTWAIRYLVVNTSNWWIGHQVLVSPQWITEVSWPESRVSVNLTRESIRSAPAYVSTEALNREQEAGLYGHHQRSGYWEGGSLRESVR
jgi:uncharacterized protein YrrD